MVEKLCNLIVDEEAPTAVEYAIMVAGVAIAVVTTVYLLGDSTDTRLGEINPKLSEDRL